MDFFSFGRTEGFPAQYPSKHTPVTIDVTEALFVAVFIIIGIAYLCIIPGYSKKRSVYMVVQTIFSISIGCLIIVENYGQEWEVGSVKTKTPYRAGEKQEINSTIGLKIGLRSINITLSGKAEKGTPLEKETINYNERFSWTWDQGRFGFGPYAGLLQRSFRDAQRRGLPIPILSIAEYFTIDGEGIRFGRFYRTAGWYCHILLWAAFAGWMLANIFLQSVGRYAAYIIATVGGLQLLTCIVWFVVHNPTPLVIPFEDGAIRVCLGRHFWMTLCCGILCLLLSLIIIFMDLRYPNALSTFLGIDPLDLYDECIIHYSELDSIRHKDSMKTSNSIEMNLPSSSQTPRKPSMVMVRRRSVMRSLQKFSKASFDNPFPVKIPDDDTDTIYINQRIADGELQESKGPTVNVPPVPKKYNKVKVII